MYQFLNDKITLEKLKDVEVQDLLGRDPIKVNLEEIIGYVQDKVVMVTGGGGSVVVSYVDKLLRVILNN